MPMISAPGYWEPGPAPPPKRGLFSVADVRNDVDPHVMLGVQYQTNRCTTGMVWEEMCEPPGGELKDFMGLTDVEGASFTVYDALECEPVGITTKDQEKRLRETFDAKAEAVCEAKLQSLLAEETVLPAASPVTMVGLLEEHIARIYAGRGTLHMDRHTSVAARRERLIELNGDRVETINGTPVALGRGYQRNAGKYWTGATGRVFILRGPKVAVSTPPLQGLPPRALMEQQHLILVECVRAWSETGEAV